MANESKCEAAFESFQYSLAPCQDKWPLKGLCVCGSISETFSKVKQMIQPKFRLALFSALYSLHTRVIII